VDGSIATAAGDETQAAAAPVPDARLADEVRLLDGRGVAAAVRAAIDRADARWIVLALVVLGLAAYVIPACLRPLPGYDHFAWQADAWLHGRATIPFPYDDGRHATSLFQDVLPVASQPGYGTIPYPPLPAILLLPLVALFGLDASQAVMAAALATLNLVLAWRLANLVARNRSAALAAALFFGFGTAAWYAVVIGSTWFVAHTVAISSILLSVNIALGGTAPGAAVLAGPVAATRRLPFRIEPGGASFLRAFAAAFFLGLGGLARLPVFLGVPFVLFAGRGSPWRRAVPVALGVGIPLAALLAYNLAATGALFNPAYEYAAVTEYHPIAALYHQDWGVEDLRYLPQNLFILLAWPPDVYLNCGLGLFDPACGTLQPDPIAMSIILTSPVYLLAVPLVRRVREDRVIAGALLAAGAIALVDLAHFSQGWVQFGYRFANDYSPFLLVLVALAIAERGLDRRAAALVGISLLVNAWGCYWGDVLGW
jgi:hypothetical protein